VRFWEENRRLVQGIVAAVILLAIARLIVIRRYEGKIEKVRTDRVDLKEALAARADGAQPASLAIRSYREANRKLAEDKAELKGKLGIQFPDWADKMPDGASPAVYFRQQAAKWREILSTECVGRVNLDDPDLGFDPGRQLDKKSAQEDLRRLAVVVRLVRLLRDAKVHTIRSIQHDAPVLTGAWFREKNPNYRPDARVAAFRNKLIIRKYPEFIREYPTRIELITELDPLMKFLHSVRQKDQFLVIRSLEAQSAAGEEDSDENVLPAGMLRVHIAAAGMSFLAGDEVAEIEREAAKSAAPKPKAGKPVKKREGPIEPLGV